MYEGKTAENMVDGSMKTVGSRLRVSNRYRPKTLSTSTISTEPSI